MKKPALRALPSLAETWQVSCVPFPSGNEVGIEAMLLVVSAPSGRIRLVEPLLAGQQPGEPFRKAFLTPMDGPIGRPESIACEDRTCLLQLRLTCTEAGVVGRYEPDLAELVEAKASLLSSFGGPPAPGVSEDAEAWASALTDLLRVAPWRALADDRLFTFRGGPLDGLVAAVIGHLGQLRGVVAYPSAADHAAFLALPDTPSPELLAKVRSLAVHVAETSEYTAAERADCETHGLALPGGFYPRIFIAEDGGFRSPDPVRAYQLRTAVRAIVAFCEAHANTLEDDIPLSGTVLEGLERTEVELGLPGPHVAAAAYLPLIDWDYAMHTGKLRTPTSETYLPSLIFKMRKPEAGRLARSLVDVDSIQIRQTCHVEVLACVNGEPIGELAHLDENPELAVELRAHPTGTSMYLAVSSGGSTRHGIVPNELVYIRALPVHQR